MILTNKNNQICIVFGNGTLRLQNFILTNNKTTCKSFGVAIHDDVKSISIGYYNHNKNPADAEIFLRFNNIEGLNVFQALLDHVECLMIEENYMMDCLKEMNQC